MKRNREIGSGRSDRFRIELAFLDDPNPMPSDERPSAKTWGTLRIWVGGTNVCEHWVDDVPVDATHWYMLPFLEWLASNWTYLLHEQRLPINGEDDDAWNALGKSSEPPPLLDDASSDAWSERWSQWWLRHSLWSCRDGGLFPDLYIRRYQEQIEFSWSNCTPSGIPENVEYRIGRDCVRINVSEVEDCLLYVLDWAGDRLLEEDPMNEDFKKLSAVIRSLPESRSSKQTMAVLTGMFDKRGSYEGSFSRLVEPLKDADGWPADLFFDAQFGSACVIATPTIAAMCRTLSPTISSGDTQAIFALVRKQYQNGGPSEFFRRVEKNEPLIGSAAKPHEDGYRLAELLHELTEFEYIVDNEVQIERLLQDLAIPVEHVHLSDLDLRALAVISSQISPFIAINKNYRDIDKEPRRFTLAHELCHLLHDQSWGQQMAMASSPWAPRDIERRANAFAARFLMPYDLTYDVIASQQNEIKTASDIWKLAKAMNVSFSACVYHLCNLHFLDWSDRERLIENQLLQYETIDEADVVNEDTSQDLGPLDQ